MCERQIVVLKSTERGFLTTLICCTSAGGTFVLPMGYISSEKYDISIDERCSSWSVGVGYSSGWVQTNLFTQWFEHFTAETNPTQNDPILLILDGNYSHKRNLDLLETLI